MKIKHTSGPKLGVVEHVNNTIGATLVAAGLADHIKYKDFRERLSEESAAGSDPSNTVVTFYKDPEWGVAQLVRKLVIIKKHLSEIYRFESEEQARDYGCPESVLKRYRDIKALPGPDQAGAVLAQAKHDQMLRDHADKTAKYKVLG
jgi:hypothetical protein